MPSVVRLPCFSLAWLPEACLAEKAKLQFLAENMAGAVTGEQRPPDREPREWQGQEVLRMVFFSSLVCEFHTFVFQIQVMATRDS